MIGIRAHLGQFICILLLVQQSLAFFSLPSPWGYRCGPQGGPCIKEENSAVFGLTTLAECKLTCGPHGALWPKPNSAELGKEVVKFLPKNISQRMSAHLEVSNLLEEALSIFKKNIEQYHPEYSSGMDLWENIKNPKILARSLFLDFTVSGMDTQLTLETDESYTLAVLTNGNQTTATIIAASFFGARHALETLSQLIDHDEITGSLMIVSSAMISDSPAFPYRGILLDTSRNFISVRAIERTLDAMAANKLNTFHWHITDSHSFPLYLTSLPKMAYYGAYSSSQIYYPADVKHVVNYGRVRGIRIMPEFEAPTHVGNGFQWGPQNGLGNLAVCVNKEPWLSYCAEPPCGQLNLANPKMYDILGQIYKEMVEFFSPIDLFHHGGSEVNLNCWNTTDEITNWMTENGYGLDDNAYYKQWSVFQEKAHQLLTAANKGKKVPAILWTSNLTVAGRADQYLNAQDYILHIWKQGYDPLIGELLDKKFRVIFTNYDHWFLDCGFGAWVGEGNNWCSPYNSWQKVYDNSPLKLATNLTASFDPKLVLGGEAALWTEQADDAVVDSRIWPRGAALGERLWSNPDHNWEPAEVRLVHQRQRLVKRGIEADRIQPQWCHQNEGLCSV
ncbi:chitooligosaccharidolytic beta-N-acetylglucosaminidase-like [Palaemon carinicauda]|uniref:chitooligosaccharidolytic beta-N-acetylglucosaminidase-like n=1 Tax=Palaemon carinicauda TaxID=392227 RepID=UPI0035B58242